MNKVIALDIGATKIAGGVVEYEQRDLPPVVSCRMTAQTLPQRKGDAVLETVVELAGKLLQAAMNDSDANTAEDAGIVGIGVGSSGTIDPTTGSVRYSSEIMPGWSGQPLCRRLSGTYGLPATALGDVQAHALGAARWGAARGSHSCLCVGIGTGLGGAFVLENQVAQGFRGHAGHIGHTIHPAAAGLVCACGAPAHAELVASGTAIATAYQNRLFTDELDPTLMGDEVARRANKGELEALAVIEANGRALGEALGSWCNLLDPELVVLCGSVTAAGHAWRIAVDEGFKSQIMQPLADMAIVYAALGPDAALIGAAEHLLDKHFKPAD